MIKITHSTTKLACYYHASDVASIEGRKSKDYPATACLVQFFSGGYLYSSDKPETIARRVAQALGRKKEDAT